MLQTSAQFRFRYINLIVYFKLGKSTIRILELLERATEFRIEESDRINASGFHFRLPKTNDLQFDGIPINSIWFILPYFENFTLAEFYLTLMLSPLIQ